MTYAVLLGSAPVVLLHHFKHNKVLHARVVLLSVVSEPVPKMRREDMVEVTGPDHPYTLETEDAIGYALTALGRPQEAEPMHRRTLELKSAMMGADSPYALMSREYLARALLAQGEREEARTLLVSLVADRERVLGPNHRRTAQARELLAGLERAE